MKFLLFYFVLSASLRHVNSTFVALAPSEFHPGSTYSVQLTLLGSPFPGERVTVFGNIFNAQQQSMGAGSVTLNAGDSGILNIPVAAGVTPDPNGVHRLQLDGSGGLSFSNFTALRMSALSQLVLVQTDKKVYRAGQLVRFRVIPVNKQLIPQRIAKNITIQNPQNTTLATFYCDGSRAVYENTYQLTDFPDLGLWKIVVQPTRQRNMYEEMVFTVDDYVLPKFEVSAEVTPEFVITGSGETKVTVGVKAKYTSGKGVMGYIKVTVVEFNQVINSEISASSGGRDVAVDLADVLRQVGDNYDSLALRVEVTDAAQRTYHTTAVVRLRADLVKVSVDTARTDLVYNTGFAYQAVVCVTDNAGQPLPETYAGSQLTVTLSDPGTTLINQVNNKATQVLTLAPGQTDYQLSVDKDRMAAFTAPTLQLTAILPKLDGGQHEVTQTVHKFQTIGNATLSARWIDSFQVLSIGGNASFVVDVSEGANFSSITYTIVSRGNVQAFGHVTAGQPMSVKVNTTMCPQGRLLVYGVRVVPGDGRSEVVADSLELKVRPCQDKQITPSVAANGQRAGTAVNVSLDVTWADPHRQWTVAVGRHEVHVLAVDKKLLRLQGDNDLDLVRLEAELLRFHISPNSTPVGEGTMLFQRPLPSTGELLKELGLILLSDVQSVPPLTPAVSPTLPSETDTSPAVHVHKHFRDTWLWTTAFTDDNGRLSLIEPLPDSVTSWVISAFAVRGDTPLAITAQPFELNAVNKFFVSLNLPSFVRRTEKFELRATVFNYEGINVDTTVILAPSDNYVISGDSTASTFVKSDSYSTVTFSIVASKVGVISFHVSATARRNNGATISDRVHRNVTVRPEGVARSRSVTLPVVLSGEQPVFNHNVSLDAAPWSSRDVVSQSRTVCVKVTGDMMGHALEDVDKLVQLPRGCGEQNMLTTAASVYAMTYLTAVDDLKTDFRDKAKEYMKIGYVTETQQFRRSDAGYSAFGHRDQASSTWLTAFVVRSMAQAKQFIPETVDVAMLDSALRFLLTSRLNNQTGLFFELGSVLHEEMQGGAGAGDALSVYVTICMLEARQSGVQVDASRVELAMRRVREISTGERVTRTPFLAAITAYALGLYSPASTDTQRSVLRLVGYILTSGAPWTKSADGAEKAGDTSHYHPPPPPGDIEVTAYCILAYTAISKFPEGRDLVFWLQRQQNSNGGFRSTQDTVVALQALARYAEHWVGATPISVDVVISTLYPARSTRKVSLDDANAAILQIIELPGDTSKVNIRVTGRSGSLAVVKVVWHFYTAPETVDTPPSESGAMDVNSKKLVVSTSTTMVRPGFHNVKACISPKVDLDYSGMVVMTMDFPSGWVPDDLNTTRVQNPDVIRVEQDQDKIHLYMTRPRVQCVNVVMEETAKVDSPKPGAVTLIAYYKPDIKSEAVILLGLTCTGDNCDSSRSSYPTSSGLLLANCLFFFLAFAFHV